MLRLPPLDLHQPASLPEVLALLAEHGETVRLFAGGTDLLPNLKLGMTKAAHLVALGHVPELRDITLQSDTLTIGATVRLAELADDPLVRDHAPALAFAAGCVASPQIRNQGTLGGNLCLDTRCRYINQSELWREALGGCLKSHGSECHVVPGGQGCVAALSSDTAPVLIAYGARVDVLGPGGLRAIPVAELYDTDGLRHVRIDRDEVLVRVHVPRPGPDSRIEYRKWAVRKSIDFPLVSVAVRLDLQPGTQTLAAGTIVVGALGPRPRVLALDRLAGATVDDALAVTLGDLAHARCRPLPNVPYDAAYRRERLAVEVRRAVQSVVATLVEAR